MKDEIEFYQSKGKLFFATIFLFVFVVFGILIVNIAYIEESMYMFILGLFIIVLFGFFAVGSIFKMIRGYPYIRISDTYIQLDSFTKSEVTIYFTDIEHMKVSKSSFQNIIEIVLYDESAYFDELSFHNKVRLFMNRVTGFSLFTISAKAVRKQERDVFLETLDLILQRKLNNDIPIVETVQKQNVETDFMKKYDRNPPMDRSIDRSYFLRSYAYGLLPFTFSFILFYLLISKDDNYLFYIIVSLILYPFAKVLIDWLFGFKLKHVLDKQKGFTYYFEQLRFIFHLFLFHVSFFVAPIGMLFLLIRYIVIRIKR